MFLINSYLGQLWHHRAGKGTNNFVDTNLASSDIYFEISPENIRILLK